MTGVQTHYDVAVKNVNHYATEAPPNASHINYYDTINYSGYLPLP